MPATPSSARPPSTASGDDQGAPRDLPAEQPIHAESGERGDRQRDQEERHAGGADLLHHRHHFVPQIVERRVAAERHQQEQERDGAERLHQPPPAPVADPERREHHDDRAEILGVQLEEVAAPVAVEHRR